LPDVSQTYVGACHCGGVCFEIEPDFPELTEYQFHTHTARHFFCKVCGIYPFHRKRVTPDHLGINVFCLEGFDPAGIPVRRTAGAAMP
jgi:hypothetical protein